MWKPLATFLTLLILCPPLFAAQRSIIVLDASGSMWGQIASESKIEIARHALSEVLASVPADQELGLMVYGHREKGACSDIELAVPPAPGTAVAIAAFAQRVSPKGKTPLTDAVRQAADALRFTEEKSTVILVTDGLETCDADPCALARTLEGMGVDLTVHVVGFGLSDAEGLQVACLAEGTGGRYLKAADAGTLGEALRVTVADVQAPPKVAEPEPIPEPTPARPEFNVVATAALAENGPLLEEKQLRWELFPIGADGQPERRAIKRVYGSRGEASLPAGRYLLRTSLDKVVKEQPVEVTETDVSEPRVILDAAVLTITPKRRADDSEPDAKARVDVMFKDGKAHGYGATRFYVPAGPLAIQGQIGQNVVEETLQATAGEVIEKTLMIGSGRLVATTFYADGGPVVEASVYYNVLKADAGIDGERKAAIRGSRQNEWDVPAGEFVVQAAFGKAKALSAPFVVEAGERTEVSVNLNAGVLAVTAPGASQIRLLSGTPDLQGKRERIAAIRTDSYQETLPAGEYRIEVEYQEDRPTQERMVTIKAGERAEIALD